MSAAAWIFKTEPSTYAFHQLQKAGPTWWDGIRNYQARNSLRVIEPGALLWIYHSGNEKAVVGQAKALGRAVPEDDTQPETWVKIQIEAVRPTPRPLLLKELKAHLKLKQMALIKQSRLSVSPVTQAEHEALLQMAGWAS
jgi:predicted RNA-binding protein with PUA-like domain